MGIEELQQKIIVLIERSDNYDLLELILRFAKKLLG